MILKFGIKNFRSFKNYIEINFSSKYTDENNFAEKGKYKAEKVIGIFGANASGKSNFIDAFFSMLFLIRESAEFKNEQEIAFYEPFLLSEEKRKQPTKFHLQFVLDKIKMKKNNVRKTLFLSKNSKSITI